MRFGGGGRGEKYSAVHQSSEDVLLFLSLDQSDAKKKQLPSHFGEK